ncbi:MAG: 4Fe-4S binding protein [Coriobacteriales bacterium]|jgi:ferredoxin-type protein NapH|nr:4Fe-4S binding protein [Coriobacteriales bacterium]
MSSEKVRVIVASAVFVSLSVGLVVGVGTGTLSGLGWDDISLLCPLGALAVMISTRTLIPRAVISLVAMVLVVLALGRAFCGWACPVPLLERVRGFFRSPKRRKALKDARRNVVLARAKREPGCAQGCPSSGSCAQKRAALDSRHFVLGGALLSTAVFGFPVFCLVCPVGLTFATVLTGWRLFAFGDVTWSVVLVPLLLVVEIVVLRKWCTRICPLAGLMNLVSRFSRTFRPVIDDNRCLETAEGKPCSRCALACDAGIDVRHPDFGERGLADCTHCRACLDACPTGALSMPLLAGRSVRTKASGGLEGKGPEKENG